MLPPRSGRSARRSAPGLHVVQRVQQHVGIALLRGQVHQALGQHAAQPAAAVSGAHVQALHLAGVGVVHVGQRPQADAAGGLAVHQRQQQCPRRLGVFTGQAGQFGLEVLETQVHAQRVGVFAQQQTHRGQQRGVCGAHEDDLWRVFQVRFPLSDQDCTSHATAPAHSAAISSASRRCGGPSALAGVPTGRGLSPVIMGRTRFLRWRRR
jgi:hypothetical protein